MRVAGRPVRRTQGEGDVVFEPYRGYGTRSEVFLIGRVFRQSRPDPAAEGTLRSELRDIGRRLSRRQRAMLLGAVLVFALAQILAFVAGPPALAPAERGPTTDD